MVVSKIEGGVERGPVQDRPLVNESVDAESSKELDPSSTALQ